MAISAGYNGGKETITIKIATRRIAQMKNRHGELNTVRKLHSLGEDTYSIDLNSVR